MDMSFDDYLRIGVDDYGYLVAQNFGEEMEDPFFGSVLHYHQRPDQMPHMQEVQSGDGEVDEDAYFDEGTLFVAE